MYGFLLHIPFRELSLGELTNLLTPFQASSTLEMAQQYVAASMVGACPVLSPLPFLDTIIFTSQPIISSTSTNISTNTRHYRHTIAIAISTTTTTTTITSESHQNHSTIIITMTRAISVLSSTRKLS